MSDRLLLDTDLLVEYLRGRAEAGEWLESQDADLAVSAITVAELCAGIKGARESQLLDRFLLALEVLPATEEIGRLAGQYRRDYGPSHGTGLADALIAATATVDGSSLVTFNRRHFPMLPTAVVPYQRR
jgi:predicted nucleic acid-binding protein